MQSPIQMANVGRNLLLGLRLLASDAAAGGHDGLFELSGLRQQERIRLPFWIVRTGRRRRHLDVSH